MIQVRPDVVPSIERNLMDRGILASNGHDVDTPITSPRSEVNLCTPVREKTEKDDDEDTQKLEIGESPRHELALAVDSVHQWDRSKSQHGRVSVDIMRRALMAAQPAIFSDANPKSIVTRGARARSQVRLLEYLEFLAPCIDSTTTIPSNARSDIAFIDHVPL